MSNTRVAIADLDSPDDQHSIVEMMDAYSCDQMGDGKPLSKFARKNLVAGLREHPTTLVFLARADDLACGIATCFGGFSTFAARPLLNISDYFVEPDFRGRGVGKQLLDAIELEAVKRGCCKITLEVQENNRHARAIYDRFGFTQAVYVADAGGSLFMSKSLINSDG